MQRKSSASPFQACSTKEEEPRTSCPTYTYPPLQTGRAQDTGRAGRKLREAWNPAVGAFRDTDVLATGECSQPGATPILNFKKIKN